MQKLRAAVHFPLPKDLEGFAIEHEDAAGAVAVRRAKRTDVNPFRSAVNGVWARVVRPGENFLRLDDFDDHRFTRVGLGVDDVNPRRANPGDNQITPFDVRMRCVRAERRAARVPTEVMKLVAKLW